MQSNHRRTAIVRALAMALALNLIFCAPAGAAGGLFGWLFGDSDDAVEASAPAVELTLTDSPAPDATPTATFAAPPIPDAAIEDDGLIRVYLQSLKAPRQLNLTFAGSYAVDEMPFLRFDRYAHVLLTAGDGRVYLSAGGLNLDLGESVTFNRHQSDGLENGVYIAESEKDAAYCGDLTVSVGDDGGLRAVLAIPVEEYLLGVVAYEMSDSFPVEALKAQAVAARTYAMQRKHRAGNTGDYDLVDTTADQVYKGYDASYTNVAAAVEATRGVVGLYNGDFATCYYTASNGGQTALPSQIWGTAGKDGYLAMADDPYDVENPRSLQNELTITPQCGGSAALKAMLEAALAEQVAARSEPEGAWTFDCIEAIEPVNPRFEGSRMYDGLKFTLRALPAATAEATASPTASASPEPTATADAMPTAPDMTLPPLTVAPTASEAPENTFEVVLSTYEQIKGGLSLGLNGGDYELVSVETTPDETSAPAAFTIVMRRYGHGVGMSQRGAQWMAGHYEKGWQEILAFYYPGMSLQRMAWPETELTALDALPDGVGKALPAPTPTPTPAPLPALESGEYYAKVTATLLNVRARPTTDSEAIDQLAKDRRVIVRRAADADGWVPIRTAELEGYVKAEYLERES